MIRRTLLAVLGSAIPIVWAGCLGGGSPPDEEQDEPRPHERVVEIGFGDGGPLADDASANERSPFSVAVIATEDDVAVLADDFLEDEPDVRSFVEETAFGREGIVVLQGVFESTRYRFDVDSLSLEDGDDVTGSVAVEALDGGEDALYRETVFVRAAEIRTPETTVTLTIRHGDDETTVTAYSVR